MNNNNDVIIFSGDSFTWGEGLELYTDTPKWINERTKQNRWAELYQKQDYDAQQFRKLNRFSTLVSNHFNVDPIVYSQNGGSFESIIDTVKLNLQNSVGYSPNNVKSIIIQFTTLDRMLLHLTLDCKCSFCKNTGYEKPWRLYTKYLQRHLTNDIITDSDYWGLDWLEKTENIPYKNIREEYGDEMWNKINSWFKRIYVRNLNILMEKYISKWEKVAPVYFIDSWELISSNILSEIPEFKEKMIPLLGYDNKYYTKYLDWESTFPYKRIVDEFPNTFNGHPTLIQNQYLAKSIIKHIER